MESKSKRNNFKFNGLIMENKKRPIWLYIVIGIVLLLFIGVAFTGGHFWTKRVWTEIVQKKDSLILDSQNKQKELKSTIKENETRAMQLETAINKLSNENSYLYSELRKKERALRTTIDTSFRSNANRIKSSVDRYLKATDSIN